MSGGTLSRLRVAFLGAVLACSGGPEDEVVVRVDGVVLSSLSRNPVVGATVSAGLYGATSFGGAGLVAGNPVTTDASGRFRVERTVTNAMCESGRLVLWVTAPHYQSTPPSDMFGHSIECGDNTLAPEMDPEVLSITIFPSVLTVPLGGSGVLEARGTFFDGWSGLVPESHDLVGALWKVAGTGTAGTCGYFDGGSGKNPAVYRPPVAPPPAGLCGSTEPGKVKVVLHVALGGGNLWDSLLVTIR